MRRNKRGGWMGLKGWWDPGRLKEGKVRRTGDGRWKEAVEKKTGKGKG